MKKIASTLGVLLMSALVTAAAQSPPTQASVHRYVIERTFPQGALEGLDAGVKARVNANNSKFGVRWVMSYANAQKTKTYCVYEGPDEAAIRKAAAANKLPVDSVTEVPLTLLPR